MVIDQNAGTTATETGSATTGQAEDTGQASGSTILTAKAGTPASDAAKQPTGTPSAEGGTPELPGWIAALTSDQRADANLMKELAEKFPKGAPQLVQDYVARKGKTVPAVPNEKASPEEWAAYRKAMGVPDKASDYKLEKGKAPKGLEYPDTMVESLRKVAHQAALTPEQAQKVFVWSQIARLEDMRRAATEVRATVEQTTEQLKNIWKGNYDLEMGYMERAAETVFKKYPNLADKFSRTGLGNDPEVLQMFAWLGRQWAPGRMIQGSPSSGAGEKSLAERIYPKLN